MAGLPSMLATRLLRKKSGEQSPDTLGAYMKLNKDSWHYKLYSWWLKDKYGPYLAEDKLKGIDYRGVNLCPYLRAVLLKAPLRWLLISGGHYKGVAYLQIVLYGFLLTRLPFWAGMYSFELKRVIFIIYSLAGLIAIGAGLLLAVLEIFDRIDFDIDDVLTTTVKLPKFVSDTFSLAYEAWSGFHNKICPIVRFK
jgi:hypothetical protein